MKLTIGFSPCPNDTFIFDALVHGKIDTKGLEFEVVMADVEELNRQAFMGGLDVTKLSYHAYAHLIDQYVLLDAGSALGKNCGPLLIAKAPMSDEAIASAKIAIPGKYTTANFLLSLAFPNATDKRPMLFSQIENAVLAGEVDAGLIIHENRFTYEAKGLKKLIDLGEYWEESTGLPIPLGGIVASRKLPLQVQRTVNQLVRQSVEHAFAHPDSPAEFIKQHAQEMDEQVMREHIRLYVNDFTVALGGEGRTAIWKLFDVAKARGVIPFFEKDLFIH